MEILGPRLQQAVKSLHEAAEHSFTIVSPWVTDWALEASGNLREGLDYKILTVDEHVIDGTSSIVVLEHLVRQGPRCL